MSISDRTFHHIECMKNSCPEKTMLVLEFKRAASEYAEAVTELERQVRSTSPHSKTRAFAEEARAELKRCEDDLRTHIEGHSLLRSQ